MLQSRNDEDDAVEGDGASYQLDMMRCLREVNVDNNTVGWCAMFHAFNICFQDVKLTRADCFIYAHSVQAMTAVSPLGRYQSTVLGSFQTVELIETFVNYAESIKRCVCLVYDPQKSATGSLALKAIKLRDSFLKVQMPSPDNGQYCTASKLQAVVLLEYF